MVYNALKLFMEINPDLFEETMQQYKQSKIEERHHAVERYETWKRLRDQARTNANGSLPEGFDKDEPEAPPPAPADDADILDLALDLNDVTV